MSPQSFHKTSEQLISRILHRKAASQGKGGEEASNMLCHAASADPLVSSGPSGPSGPSGLARFDTLPAYKNLCMLRAAGQRLGIHDPFFKVHQGPPGAVTCIDGRQYRNFSHYNYLGLAGHEEVNRVACEAIEKYGTSAGASRLVAGERPVQRALETALAQVYGAEDCAVFVSGHATNVSVISTLFGPGDLVVHDSLAHNSIVEGARLSGAARRSFVHNDALALDALLTEVRPQFQRVLIVVEGLYSMDGDIADIPAFIDIKYRHAAFLMVDEAHALGVLGTTGRGTAEHYNVLGKHVDIWMGTLSKTLAACGGYVAGSRVLVDVLKHSAPAFVYSVGISPPLAAAALAALHVMQREPQRVQRLYNNTQLFLQCARECGLNTGLARGFGVVPVMVGSSHRAVELSHALFVQGINVQPIMHPAVEEKTARLRFFLSSLHGEQDIRDVCQAVKKQLALVTNTLTRILGLLVLAMTVSGCAIMPKSGPYASQVVAASHAMPNAVPHVAQIEGLIVRIVDNALARRLMEQKRGRPFTEVFGESFAPNYIINPGDLIEVSIWESPPNMLFGGAVVDSKTGTSTTRAETLPVQMVMEDGKITVPFAGRIDVKGRTLRDIERHIEQQLQGQAHQPQAMVRAVQNNSTTVAVLGDVNKNALFSLTPKGERILDVIAMAGGVKAPVPLVSLQLSRNARTAVMPMDSVIQQPKENILLQPGDVLTALYQPKAFSILGAVTKNGEIPFEARGISLAQALARAGGLVDTRSDPGGVFIFRFENPLALEVKEGENIAETGTMPVVYQVDFSSPSAFLITQHFPIQDKDVIYVANMPSVELEKFLKMIGTVLTPTVNLTNAVRLWDIQ